MTEKSMKKNVTNRIAAIMTALATSAAAYATICYGIYEELTIYPPSGPPVIQNCQDLGPAPSGAWTDGGHCFYVFCNTAVNCSGGQPDSQAWKRFRELWMHDTYPYLYTKNAPSDVPYGCCDCNPTYSQTVPPVPE